MTLRPRIVWAITLLLILPTLWQPAGGRIIVACIDGSDCPDITRRTLTPRKLARCERACERDGEGAGPMRASSNADELLACDQPCGVEATFRFTTPLCAKRCVVTTVPARDLPPTRHTDHRVITPVLMPLPIAEDLLAAVVSHETSAVGRAIEHVPIIVHQIALEPAEGIGARSPPRRELSA